MVTLSKKKRVCLQKCKCRTKARPPSGGAGAHRCPPRPVSTVWAESRAVSRPQARSQQLNTAGGGWPRLGETRSLSGGGELCCSALQRLLPFQKEQRAGVLRQEWAKESDQLLKNSDPPLHTCRHLGPGNLYFISSTQVILMHLCQEPQCKDPWLARSIYD